MAEELPPEPAPSPVPPPVPGNSFLDQMAPHATKIMLGAAAVGLISVFLPAASISMGGFSASASAVDGWQGKLGLVAYIAVGVMAGIMLSNPNTPQAKNLSLACLITAGIAAFIALFLVIDVMKVIAIGAILDLLASLALVAGAVFQAKKVGIF